MDLNKLYKKNDETEIVEYEVDETGAMIYVENTEETHMLNETACYIFRLCTEPISFQQILDSMLSEYEISVDMLEQVKIDISNCLTMLLEKQLILESM